jgi:gamma-glutamyltranspeptidase/glutathione hydrolase
MASLIQSNFDASGSAVVRPGTGVTLHSRGSNISLEAGRPNQVGPGKKPLLTIIPGFMGNAHGAPRFMVSPHEGSLKLEAGIAPAAAAALAAPGHRIEGLPHSHLGSGAAQLVLPGDGHYAAASDDRRDGQVIGL